MSVQLKVKAKHLAEESRIIHIEEKRAKVKRDTATVNSLNLHRTGTVRSAARHTHLARAFLAGMPYRSVEAKLRQCTPHPSVSQITSMVAKYGEMDRDAAQSAIQDWLAA